MPHRLVRPFAPRNGYSLLELSVVIAIIAVVVGMSLSAGDLQIKAAEISGTQTNLGTVQTALNLFQKKSGRYPCPASPTDASGAATYGVEAASCPVWTCPTGQTCPASGHAMIGMVPFKTLGLNEETAYDKWDNRLLYVIDKNHVIASKYGQGSLVVVDSSGNTITGSPTQGDAVFLVISQGPNGNGAYGRAGTIATACPAVNATKDQMNCDYGANTPDTFRDMAVSDSGTAANVFDDLVVWQGQMNLSTTPMAAPSIGLGAKTGYAATGNGMLYSWGFDANSVGLLGQSATTTSAYPAPLKLPAGVQDWTQVTPWADQTAATGTECALRSSGAAYCWGGNTSGVLGIGSAAASVNVPTQITAIGNFTQLSAAWTTVCGLTATSQIYCWGANTNGALGNASAPATLNAPSATYVVNNNDWTAVDVGSDATNTTGCGIRNSPSTGAIWCWGSNLYGQFGNNTTSGASTTTPVQGANSMTGFTALSGATTTYCALQTANLYCWGRNNGGSVGNGTTTQQLVPYHVANSDWMAVSAGDKVTCGIRGVNAGTMYCWGDSSTSRLGIAGSQTAPTTAVSGGYTDWKSVVVGQKTVCGLRSDRSMWCWGTNSNYQFGTGVNTPASSSIPAAAAWSMGM